MTNLPFEYSANPLVRSLGPLLTLTEIAEKITIRPRYDPAEREQAHSYRRHCCLRLLRAFFPLKSQVLAVERLHMMIRDGYLGRNPNTGGYREALLNAVERIERSDIELESSIDVSTVGSAANIGAPGMGKSTTFALAARTLPAITKPDVDFTLTQIPIIQIQCPIEGSVKQFCRSFFKEVDNKVGWDRYFRQFGQNKISAEMMLLHVQHLCHLHAVGVILIDEIQNLLTASGTNADALMKFYVTMTNTIGVPVLLIGTMAATEILQSGFHAARRADGYGSEVWHRSPYNDEWRSWLELIWRYQWTNYRTRLTDDLAAVVYQETQGILDLAVRLHMLVQMHLITLSETSGNGFREVITTEVIEKVAQERLNMVRPMVIALREGRSDAFANFRDINGYQQAMDGALAAVAGLTTEEYHRRKFAEIEQEEAVAINDPFFAIRASIRGRGFTATEAEAIIAKAEAEVPSGDHLLIMTEVIALVNQGVPTSEKAKSVAPRPKRQRQPIDDPDDVRNLASRQRHGGTEAA